MPVKKVEAQDLEEISQLIAEEFPYTDLTPEKIAQRLSAGIEIFKLEEDELIGFIELEQLSLEVYRINALQVKEEFRGQQYGRELLEFALNYLKAKGAQGIILLVKKDNETAKKLYQKMGFQFLKDHEKLINGKKVEEMQLRL